MTIDKTSPRFELNQLVDRLNDRIDWEKPNHRLQVCYKHGMIIIYNTSQSNRDGEHIFLKLSDYYECISFLKIADMLMTVNELYGTHFNLKWNCDYQRMEVLFAGQVLAYGDNFTLKIAVANKIGSMFKVKMEIQ